MKQFLKKTAKKILSSKLFVKFSKGNRFIFVFHDVSNPNSSCYSEHYSSSVEEFRSQIQLIKNCFEIISLEAIVSNRTLNKKKNYAAITFDDGFQSVLTNAFPVLNENNIPFSLFVNGAAIDHNELWVTNALLETDSNYSCRLSQLAKVEFKADEDIVKATMERGHFSKEFVEGYRSENKMPKTYLDKKELNLLLDKGAHIGNHSCDHLVLSNTDEVEVTNQISRNHDCILNYFGIESQHFAIPFGKKEHFDDGVIKKLRDLNYKYIYTTNPNKFKVEDLHNENFLFPRIGLTSESPSELMFYINRSLLKKYNL